MKHFRYGIVVIGTALCLAPDLAEAQTYYQPPPVHQAPPPSTTVVVPAHPAPVYSPYGAAGQSRRVSRRTSRRVSRRR